MLIRTRSSYACRDRQLTTNFELWVEIFCVPTCFHVKIPKQCLSVCQYPEKRNHHSFVNISPTIVIDTSMERSSRVLHHGNPKIGFFFFRKSLKFEFWLTTKSWNHLSFANTYQSYISNWYINGKVFMSSYYNIETQKLEFFSKNFEIEFWLVLKSWNHLSFVNISPTLVINTSMKRFSRVLQHGNPKIWIS